MFELALGASFAIISELLTIGVVGLILFFGYRSYIVLGESYLISFLLGFLLLGASSLFVALHILIGLTPPLYNDTLWMHQTTQMTGFALIAAGYYLRDRNPTFNRAIILSLVALGAMSVATVTYFALPLNQAFTAREAFDEFLYASSLAFLMYIMYELSSYLGITRRLSNALVPSAFGILIVGQVSRIIWAIGNAGLIQSDEGWVISDGAESIAIYNALIMFSFLLFAIPFVALWRSQGGEPKRET